MDMRKDRRLRTWTTSIAPLTAIALVLAAPAHAGQRPADAGPHAEDPRVTDAPRPLSLPAGPLDQALMALAAQTHQQLLYAPEVVQGRRVDALSGRFTTAQALARLVGTQEIEVSFAGPNVVVLKRRTPGQVPLTPARSGGDAGRPFVLADRGPAGDADDPQVTAAAGTLRAAAPAVDEIIVIGTHIRGVTDTPSPVLVLDRRALEQTGHLTVANALAALPQNFAGSATEASTVRQVDRAHTNDNAATGVNLRGLGANATLVLVNGRRMAGTGSKGDFADVSAIPTAAVERVEILLDGASALYGSDAVGGVVNIVLRQQFEGAETQVVAGTGTAGEPFEGRVAQSMGFNWQGGSGIVSYELFRREALPTSARDFTASADLRPLGGTDHRAFYAHPGNLLRIDPVTRSSVPGWAIPTGQNGVGLRASDFTAGAVNLQNQQLGVDLLPQQTRQSLYLAGRQALGERLELTADARYSYRRTRSQGGYPVSVLIVTPANPFFVAPDGAGFDQVAYAFADELPPLAVRGASESLGATFGADLKLRGSWAAEGYLAFAQEIGELRVSGALNSDALNEALGTIPNDPATPYTPARDGYFNPFGGRPGVNSPAVLAFVGSGFGNSRNKDQVWTANLQADGALFDLPGGPLRLALGAQARREAFLTTSTSLQSGTAPARGATIDAERSVLAVFAELRAPVVGPQNRRPGIERLEISLAARHERYEDFGGTTNPKVGVIWSPVSDLTVRASYGTSFRAPALRELRDPQQYSPVLLRDAANVRVLTLFQAGGNPDLKPETATSWSAGADFAPAALPGLRLSATWFRTAFEDRIDQPAGQNIVTALRDPTVASFLTRVSPSTSPADRARVTALITSAAYQAANGVFPAESYGALLDGRYVNTASLRVSGLDLSGSYATEFAGGRLSLYGNASKLFEYRQELTPTAPAQDRVGLTSYPLRLRARAGADWSRGAFGGNLALNYTDRSRGLVGGERVDSLVTADLQLRYEPQTGPLRGVRAVLAIRNLLDTPPPFYDSDSGFGYDAANFDAIGRFVSLELTRRW